MGYEATTNQSHDENDMSFPRRFSEISCFLNWRSSIFEFNNACIYHNEQSLTLLLIRLGVYVVSESV